MIVSAVWLLQAVLSLFCLSMSSEEHEIITKELKDDASSSPLIPTLPTPTQGEVTTVSEPETAALSKSQLRKKRRYEQAIQIKAQRKLHEKEVKLARAIAQGRDLEQEKRRMEENRLLNEQKFGIPYSKRGLETFQQKLAAAQSSFRVCFDCSFEDSMSEKEIVSLCSQIRYCYAANKKASNPVFFSLSSLSLTGKMWENLSKVSGFPDQWIPRAFSFSSHSFVDMFCTATSTSYADDSVVTKSSSTTEQTAQDLDTSNLVYLTSDSETILDRLDDSKVYIIGGIVDRNRLKGATFTKAQELGIATAKLPISQHINLFSTKVLCCNHVFEILLKCKENGYDWKKAMMEVLPARKDVQEAKPNHKEKMTLKY